MIEEKVLAKKLSPSNIDKDNCIELLVAEEVINKFRDSLNKNQWNSLVDHCPWATGFQQWKFVKAWYELYQESYLPVLIIEKKGEDLSGIFPLAMDNNGWIIGAGADQAEYQVWAYFSSECDDFVCQALDLVWSKLSPKGIHLKYLPQGTPTKWVQSHNKWQKRSFIKPHRHPILSAHSEKPSLELKKKNKREKINRLKRQGELKFERILQADRFSDILDELILQSDFRKGAAYNRELFSEDPYRKTFVKTLFDLGMLHVTLLKLDDEIIASNVGLIGKKWVHLQGINTHSPFKAKQSPGILHFLMLGQSLKEEGFEIFDLTPGADPYKSGLASEFREALELTISKPRHLLLKKWGNKVNLQIKQGLKKIGISDVTQRKYKGQYKILKNKWQHFFNGNPFTKIHKAYLDRKTQHSSPKLYHIDEQIRNLPHEQEGVFINKNSLKDLLCYASQEEFIPKQVFLMDCMKKMEEGNEVFSHVKSNKLEFLVWMNTKPETVLNHPIIEEASQPPCLLYDFYCRSIENPAFENFIKGVISKIAADNPGQEFFILSSHKIFQELMSRPSESI